MDLDDQLRRYFGTADLVCISPAVLDTGIERLRVDLLRIGDRLAAWRLHLDLGRIVYGIAGSYDPLFARYSPGLYSATRSLIEARDRGCGLFDRGAGDNGTKQQLGATAGPEIVDCLLVRGAVARSASPLIERVWRRPEKARAAELESKETAPASDHD